MTFDGLKDFGELQHLTTLNLTGPKITDEALRELSKLKGLTMLRLFNTKTTSAGVKKVLETRPDLDVMRPGR